MLQDEKPLIIFMNGSKKSIFSQQKKTLLKFSGIFSLCDVSYVMCFLLTILSVWHKQYNNTNKNKNKNNYNFAQITESPYNIIYIN